jgi:hypothetical protein
VFAHEPISIPQPDRVPSFEHDVHCAAGTTLADRLSIELWALVAKNGIQLKRNLMPVETIVGSSFTFALTEIKPSSNPSAFAVGLPPYDQEMLDLWSAETATRMWVASRPEGTGLKRHSDKQKFRSDLNRAKS